MSPTRKAHWQLHFCVLLWGFTPILGAAISLPAPQLVWWRMGLVALLHHHVYMAAASSSSSSSLSKKRSI